MNITYYGRAGHFCASFSCRYHLHAHVTAPDGHRYCVSAVGEYYPPGAKKMQCLNGNKDSFYELMVFKVTMDEAGREVVDDYGDTLLMRSYDDPDMADTGHALMVKAIAEGLEPRGEGTPKDHPAEPEPPQGQTSDKLSKMGDQIVDLKLRLARMDELMKEIARKMESPAGLAIRTIQEMQNKARTKD